MDDRTDIVETTSAPENATRGPRNADLRSVSRPAAEVNQVHTVAYDPYASRRMAGHRVTQLIYWLFGLIEGLILIRFVLKALGANSAAGFAEFIYGLTNTLVAPFVGLFGANPQAQGSLIELPSIVALIVYALLAWLLGRLASILVGEDRSAVKSRTTEIDSRLP